MSISHINFNLAIASFAIKSKNRGKSCQSYLLELLDAFPAESQSPLSWKSHALELESSLHHLKKQYETQQTELEVFKASTNTATVAKQAKPKKSSKGTAKVEATFKQAVTQLEHLVEGIATERRLPTFPRIPNALITCIETLHHLAQTNVSVTITATISTDTVQMATLNLISCVSHSLNLALTSPESSLAPHILDQILTHGLHTSFSLFQALSLRHKYKKSLTKAFNDSIYGTILQDVLLPIIQSLHKLSLAHVKAIFSDSAPEANSSTDTTMIHDLRSDISQLLCHCLLALTWHFSSRPSVTIVVDLVILEAARQLRYISGLPPEATNQARKLAKLGNKDALWWLCHIMHECLAMVTRIGQDIKEEVVRIFTDILWAGTNTRTWDEVSRMLLTAVAEKILVH